VVGLVAGGGVTAAGLLGSLAVPRLAARFGPHRLYIAISALGGLFSLSLPLLGRTTASFAWAMIGENIAQAAAFATANAIIFRVIGKNNPLAATEFTVLTSAVLLPLSYVQWLDGRGFAWGGVNGAFLTDGGLDLAGCLVIAYLLTRRRRGASYQGEMRPADPLAP
jgi:MFS transporter, PAT family, beta-lactamase induction signal transducer AmpG